MISLPTKPAQESEPPVSRTIRAGLTHHFVARQDTFALRRLQRKLSELLLETNQSPFQLAEVGLDADQIGVSPLVLEARRLLYSRRRRRSSQRCP